MINQQSPFEEFDQLLRREMLQGTLPEPITDLAQIAIARAQSMRAADALTQAFAHQKRRAWIINAISAAVLLALVIFICERVSNALSIGSQSVSISLSDQNSDIAATQTSETFTEFITPVVASLLILILAAVIERIFSTTIVPEIEIRLGKWAMPVDNFAGK